MKVVLALLVFVSLVEAQIRPDPTKWRSIDGSGNNLANPSWGKAGVELKRIGPAFYTDGFSTLRISTTGVPLNSPRNISNIVHQPPPSGQQPLNTRGLTDFTTYWGQFIDHDMTLTSGPKGSAVPLQPLPIVVPQNDLFYHSNMTIYRSVYNTSTGTSSPRQQLTLVTAWIDGSQVYGSDNVTSSFLRSYQNGLLKTTTLNGEEMPPFNTPNLTNANDAHVFPDTSLYLVGDVRGNENPALMSLHIVFLREHNRRARQLLQWYPTWTDEELYQEARRWVIALIEQITFNEYYPITIGDMAPDYDVYNDTIDPSIVTEFSTGAFRYGHSEVSQWIWRVDANGDSIPQGHLALKDSYYNPNSTQSAGIDPILRGMAAFSQNAVDIYFVDDLRNYLNGPPDRGGLDLAAVNIQRGRDHGLPGFNDFRIAYGLPPITKWSDVHPDPAVSSRLSQAYNTIDDCDIYTCGLAEYHGMDQANVGPTFVASIMDQYLRIRDGDRFWFENNQFNDTELAELKSTTLADVITRNTGIKSDEIQCFPLALPDGCGKPLGPAPTDVDFVITHKLKTPAHPYYGVGSPWGFSVNGVEGGSFTVQRLKRYSFYVQISCQHSFVINYVAEANTPNPPPPSPYTGGVNASDGDVFAALTNGFTCVNQLGGRTYLFVDANAPDYMFYGCDFHPLMGGVITVTGSTEPQISGVTSVGPVYVFSVLMALLAAVLN